MAIQSIVAGDTGAQAATKIAANDNYVKAYAQAATGVGIIFGATIPIDGIKIDYTAKTLTKSAGEIIIVRSGPIYTLLNDPTFTTGYTTAFIAPGSGLAETQAWFLMYNVTDKKLYVVNQASMAGLTVEDGSGNLLYINLGVYSGPVTRFTTTIKAPITYNGTTFINGSSSPALTMSGNKNLANPANIVAGFEFSATTNALAARADDSIIWVQISPSTSYYLSGLPTQTPTPTARNYGYYQSDKTTFISKSFIASGSTEGLLTSPALAGWVAITLQGRNSTATNFSALQMEVGSAKTSFIAYQSYISAIAGGLLKASSVDGAVSSVVPTIATDVINLAYITANLAQGAIGSKNLFNSASILAGFEFNGGTNTVLTRADDSIIWIAVTAGLPYYISGLPTTTGTRNCAFFQADKTTYISKFALNPGINEIGATAPALAGWLVITLKGRSAGVTDFTAAMVEQNSIKTPFVAYESYLYTLGGKKLRAYDITGAKINVAPVLDNDPVNYGFLKQYGTVGTIGKTALLFGDSITETLTASSTVRNNWPQKALPILGITTYNNYARSGATFIDQVSPADVRQNLSRQLSDAIAASLTPDILVVAIGTNDFNVGQSIEGSYATAMGRALLTDLDKTKIFEAMRFAFWTITLNWPNAKCYYVMPLQRASATPAQMKWFYDDAELMANEYNFKIIFANKESQILHQYETVGVAGRDLSDGLHPADSGQTKQGKLIAQVIGNTYR